MKIEVGKFYRTRDGEKAFVFYHSEDAKPFLFWHVIVGEFGLYTCAVNGKRFSGNDMPFDLVEEWVE